MIEKGLRISRGFFVIFLLSCLAPEFSWADSTPRLEILPLQSIQRKPVGKSLMLSCRPVVPNTNLVADLQWKDNMNMTILPKVSGQQHPAMYTEVLPGDQSLALIIPSLKETMAGKYYCSASYTSSQLLETAVTIETYVPITWKNAPENQHPILGSDYTVRCEVTADPPPTVDWLRDGDPIKTGDRYVVETHGLLIRNVQESDDGTYTCRAAVLQTGELVERYIRVEVYIKPEIVSLSTDLEAVEGQAFSTFCNATGKPVPEISWIKDLTQQNVATADRFLVNPQTGLLTITRVEQDDYGTYTCRAKNHAGVADLKTKLNVLVRPKIYELFNVTGAMTKEITITCRASGRPAPEITFRRWHSEEEFIPGGQPNDNRIYLEQQGDQERGESTGTLRISNAVRSDDGLYECIARNKGDTAYKTGHITVEFPPDFTYMKSIPPVFSWEERIANLSCLAESIPNATIEWRWNGQRIKDLQDPNLQINGNGPRSDLIVKPFDRRYYSVYKCIASNIHGTAEHDMQLKEGRVPGYVQSATPRVVTATTMTFDLVGPPTERGLPIIAYIVQYKDIYNPDWSTGKTREWSPDSPYIVEGLKPQTSYHFRFAARNLVGVGQWGANKEQSTPKRSAPEEPKTLHAPIQEDQDEPPIVVSPYSDHFELRWSVPVDNGEPIDYYQVRYCPGLKVNGEWSELANDCLSFEVTEATSFEMSHLSANTYYRIELRAHNAIGFSTPSSIMMKTARDNPYNGASSLKLFDSSGGYLLLLLPFILMATLTTTFQFTTMKFLEVNLSEKGEYSNQQLLQSNKINNSGSSSSSPLSSAGLLEQDEKQQSKIPKFSKATLAFKRRKGEEDQKRQFSVSYLQDFRVILTEFTINFNNRNYLRAIIILLVITIAIIVILLLNYKLDLFSSVVGGSCFHRSILKGN